MSHTFTVTKSDGTKELFDESKLEKSLKRVGTDPATIEDIVEEVEKDVWEGIPTSDIYKRAFLLLRKHHGPTAVKYSVRRALFELGPDGFPFEKFVERIFRLWGYETITDQNLLGGCVMHEVDVVAWKGEELAMCEAKFHNTFGLKSDVKVALYVKARFDDLADSMFEYGGKKRRLSASGHWLVTNTKFSDMAIKYGECKGIKMLGWNYPRQGSLHEIIEENGLHPITCLTSLTHQEKRDVIAHDILTCRDLLAKPDKLREAGIKPEAAEKVMTEARIVVNHAK